jgi:bifunctional non-homologous end joining protein LigD
VADNRGMPTRRLPAPPLELYRAKRDFAVTPEPSGDAGQEHAGERAYVIQKHAATRLHYDLRLEHAGVMWSWAVPKGPSYDPSDKRIAMRTEDHPIAYNTFEGTIPKGHYGAGTVLVWDRGTWEPSGDPEKGMAEGKLLFTVHGLKLKGQWELVRIKPKEGERGEPWILFKKRDSHARSRQDYDVVRALPDSVGPAPPPASAPARSTAKSRVRKAAGLPCRPSWPRRQADCPPMGNGSSRSSSTATACWHASMARSRACTRAMGTTGRARCRR